ncbi:DUF7882 family protein [Amnibacterium setariae]|uniref:ATP-dependent DNA ligase n=1 Tax=Amnibacterium setariae TaxID=2306585 RepID=A0A3A1U7B2_9MICO|nr:ATP-dependent DNA ligase [Amnibacterium setariae]RIX31347.1 ATP-dependent DNA ligase [Amnibacterium setariae]
MGVMRYDGTQVEFGDRLLTHVQVVVIHEFRRGEAFPMSWLKSTAVGSGRSSVWLAPQLPVHFDFVGSRVPELNRDWIDRMIESASSTRGLIVTNEDGSLAHSGPEDHRASLRRVPA